MNGINGLTLQWRAHFVNKVGNHASLTCFFLYIRIEQVNVGTGINQQGSLGITLIILDLSESFVSILSREGQLFGTSKH